MLKIYLNDNTEDARFKNAEQSLLPVDIRLIPSVNNTAGAMSVTIEANPGGTAVAEGGFDSSYDIYLRPCSGHLLDDIKVTLTESVPDQIMLSHNELFGSHFSADPQCKITITVNAIDDELGEGNHYVNVRHVITNKTNDEQIVLTDQSPLLAANLLVLIYDDDFAGVVIEETDGITATAEMEPANKGVLPELFYLDRYSLRLSKQPTGIVQIKSHSKAVATDYDSSQTPEGRDFSERTQVHINGTEAVCVS